MERQDELKNNSQMVTWDVNSSNPLCLARHSDAGIDVNNSVHVESDIVRHSDAASFEAELEQEVTFSENKNTQRKTETDMRILSAYLKSLNENRNVEDLPPADLDKYLSMFFTVVKKHDGNEYEPASLRGMLCSIERYLRLKNYQASVTRDSVFMETRNTLKSKQRRLREIGKGTKKQPDPLGPGTLERLNQLYNAKELGPYNPMSIISSLCFAFVIHFRLRKATDHKQLSWGDIKLQSSGNREYLSYHTRPSTDAQIGRAKNSEELKIWSHVGSPEKDPVFIYKIFAQKRPVQMLTPDSPFYLGVTTLNPVQNQVWFRTTPMGVNKLNDLVRMIREVTGLPRALMNPPMESFFIESTRFSREDANEKTPTANPATGNQGATEPSVSDNDLESSVNRLSSFLSPKDVARTLSRSSDSRHSVDSDISLVDSNYATAITTTPSTDLSKTTEKFKELVKRMDPKDADEFDQWLKKIKLVKDAVTGKVTVKEMKDRSELLEYLPDQRMSLNITLNTKDLLVGKGVYISVKPQISDFHPTDGGMNPSSTSEVSTTSTDLHTDSSPTSLQIPSIRNFSSEPSSPSDDKDNSHVGNGLKMQHFSSLFPIDEGGSSENTSPLNGAGSLSQNHAPINCFKAQKRPSTDIQMLDTIDKRRKLSSDAEFEPKVDSQTCNASSVSFSKQSTNHPLTSVSLSPSPVAETPGTATTTLDKISASTSTSSTQSINNVLSNTQTLQSLFQPGSFLPFANALSNPNAAMLFASAGIPWHQHLTAANAANLAVPAGVNLALKDTGDYPNSSFQHVQTAQTLQAIGHGQCPQQTRQFFETLRDANLHHLHQLAQAQQNQRSADVSMGLQAIIKQEPA